MTSYGNFKPYVLARASIAAFLFGWIGVVVNYVESTSPTFSKIKSPGRTTTTYPHYDSRYNSRHYSRYNSQDDFAK